MFRSIQTCVGFAAVAVFGCLASTVAVGQEPLTSIDQILAKVSSDRALSPAAVCSDEVFLRRATLDLLGRIPTVEERAEFLNQPDRYQLVDRLLSSDEFPVVWADLWTTQWFGYSEDGVSDREALRLWLEEQVRSQKPYDEIVRQLITARGESAFDGSVNFLLRHADEPVVKVSRAFLGVRLDCARCHDHPFDRWTQDDFTRMNRFFEVVERQEISRGNFRLTDVVREVSNEERPRFLSGAEPRTTQWRQEFSMFLVRSRPFARNFANRLWYHLMGRGIVHPVDDFSRDNPAAIPELLESLTDEVIRSNFSLQHMLKQICSSDAYQRDSQSVRGDEERQKLFLVRSVKPLTPEQYYKSTSIALGRDQEEEEQQEFVRRFYGESLDGDFSATWEYRETMQGFMSRLVESVDAPEKSIDALYQRILGRLPTDEERTELSGVTSQEITFLLMHSSEFAFNH